MPEVMRRTLACQCHESVKCAVTERAGRVERLHPDASADFWYGSAIPQGHAYLASRLGKDTRPPNCRDKRASANVSSEYDFVDSGRQMGDAPDVVAAH